MARDPNTLLTSVRQIVLVKISFIVKRAAIRAETIVVWYITSKLLQLVKHSFFVVVKTSNTSVFHLSIANMHIAGKWCAGQNSLQRGHSYS